MAQVRSWVVHGIDSTSVSPCRYWVSEARELRADDVDETRFVMERWGVASSDRWPLGPLETVFRTALGRLLLIRLEAVGVTVDGAL